MNEWVEAWSRDEGAERARAAFRHTYDREPDGVWSAPGRVNIIGEHTDYNGGLCLPSALPHRTYAAFALREDQGVRLASAQQPGRPWEGRTDAIGPGHLNGFPAYSAGVAWALAAEGLVDTPPGFDLAVDSCVPFGAGLSSSASLEAAVAVALDGVLGLGLAADDEGRTRLVDVCVRTENEVAGAPTGRLDQSASLRSVAGHAVLLDFRPGLSASASATPVPCDLAAAGLSLLVIDTRAPHQHTDGQYAARRATCEDAARTLGVETLRDLTPNELASALAELPDDVSRRRVRHVVTETDRVEQFVGLLRDGLRENAARLGSLLDASHASLRDDYEVSCSELDVAVSAAVDAGAHGARMTGGGFGGSAVALVEAGREQHVATAVAGAFAERGFTAPGFLTAEPSTHAGTDAFTAPAASTGLDVQRS